MSSHKESKALSDLTGWLSVAEDHRSSALWFERPQCGDAAVHYCAVGDTGRGARAAAGHKLPGRGRAAVAGARGQSPADPPGCSPARAALESAPAPESGSAEHYSPVRFPHVSCRALHQAKYLSCHLHLVKEEPQMTPNKYRLKTTLELKSKLNDRANLNDRNQCKREGGNPKSASTGII